MINGVYNTKIFICSEAVDMRKSFNSLTGIVRDSLTLEPLSGSLFVFKNKPGNKIKILYFDRDGYAIWYKQLIKGTFKFPEIINDKSDSVEIDLLTLRNILEGIDLASIKKRKRYKCKL